MKNKITTSISSVALMGMLVATPFAAFAQSADVSVKAKANANANFCTVINSDNFKALTNFDTRVTNLGDKRDTRDTKIDDNRTNRDQEIKDNETASQNKQDDRLAKFGSLTLTAEQKAALDSAQLAVQASLDTKTTDITSLVAGFRANMDKIRAEHRTEIDGLLGSVKVDLDAAIAKAKADCAAGVAPETVKANFQASIQAMHDKFKNDRTTVQASTKTDVQAAIDARKAEHVSIGASFRASIKSAWESFKSLFGGK